MFCSIDPIAPDCAPAPLDAWWAADPLRFGLNCAYYECEKFDYQCPDFSGCRFLQRVEPTTFDAAKIGVYKGVREIPGEFHLVDMSCGGFAAVAEYDRLIEPGSYSVTYDSADVYALTITGTVPPPTQTPTATVTPSPTSTTRLTAPCTGDCNEDGAVSIQELVTAVAMLLDNASTQSCAALDCQRDACTATEPVSPPTVNCLVAAVHNALVKCTPQLCNDADASPGR